SYSCYQPSPNNRSRGLGMSQIIS
ncbi:hypothetical protein CP08DC60_0742B, partial [Chlamydia psittaci 08DC60]